MIVVEPAGAIVGTAVSFENRLAIDPSGHALTFAWDFGDGGTATGVLHRDMAPLTFTGTAGPNVGTLVGSANGRDLVDRPWTLARD